MNNLEKIKPLIYFENESEFITVILLKRKKDCTTDKANHQSVRTIKSYSFYSIEELENKMDEIITLSDLFKARAYIDINTKSDSRIALLMMKELVTCIEDGNNRLKYIYDRCVGKLHSKQRRWIVDIDKDYLNLIIPITTLIESLKPEGIKKVIAQIPTVSGIHLITYPFDLKQFKIKCEEYEWNIDVLCNTPTILYVPESIK